MEVEQNQELQKKEKFSFGKFHDKYYKIFLLIPIFILIICILYMFIFYSQNGDFIKKDISLTGGTTITIFNNIDSNQIKKDLSNKLDDLNTQDIYDLITQEKKAVIIETKADGETAKQVLENYLGYKLTEDNSSIEFTGSTLSENFYKQLLLAVLIAFVFMAIVVFIIYRTFVPSMAVIISAFADIFMTLVVVDFLGIKMSGAGIVAFLMLIGYSVDTDILLTTRVLKRTEHKINERIFGAFKTGITMTLTSFFAVLVSLLIVKSFSLILTQIFTILVIGLGFDIFNTWITNVSIIKWYAIKKHRGENED